MRNGPSFFKTVLPAVVVATIVGLVVGSTGPLPLFLNHHPTTLAAAPLPVQPFNPTYIADVPDVEVTEIKAWAGYNGSKALVHFANGMVCVDGIEKAGPMIPLVLLHDHVHLQATVSSFFGTESEVFVDHCRILATIRSQASS